MSPAVNSQLSTSRKRSASPTSAADRTGRKNGLNSEYTVLSLTSGFTNSVPSPGPVALIDSHP